MHLYNEHVISNSEFETEFENELPFYITHQCILPPTQDIVEVYINSGAFIGLRRWFRRLTMLSEKYPDTQMYLKSSAAVNFENTRHFGSRYYLFHPLSLGRLWWQLFMTIVIYLVLIIVPLIATGTLDKYLHPVKLVLDFICLLDICVTFNTGYTDYNAKEIILDRKLTKKRYLKGYFWIDLISALPIGLFYYFYGRWSMWILCVPSLKVAHCPRLYKNFNTFAAFLKMDVYYTRLTQVFILYLLVLWWTACLLVSNVYANWDCNCTWFAKNEVIENNAWTVFLHSMYRATYIVMLVGYGIKISQLTLDIIIEVAGLSAGFVLNLIMMAEFLSMVNTRMASYTKYQDLMHQLQEYIRYKELPEFMSRRIFEYYDYHFQKRFYKEREIMSVISDRLQEDIIVSTCFYLIEKVDFFKSLPHSILAKMSACMRYNTYLANDVIIQAGIAGEKMYFIASGTIAVYSINGREICHLEDTAYFGEVSLVLPDEKRVASVVAVTHCELFRLDRKDFLKIFRAYPDTLAHMRQMALQKLQTSVEIMERHDRVLSTEELLQVHMSRSGLRRTVSQRFFF